MKSPTRSHHGHNEPLRSNSEIKPSKTPKIYATRCPQFIFVFTLYIVCTCIPVYVCVCVFLCLCKQTFLNIYLLTCALAARRHFEITPMAMLSTTTTIQYNKSNNNGADNYSPARNNRAIYLFRLTQICHYDYHISSTSRQ